VRKAEGTHGSALAALLGGEEHQHGGQCGTSPAGLASATSAEAAPIAISTRTSTSLPCLPLGLTFLTLVWKGLPGRVPHPQTKGIPSCIALLNVCVGYHQAWDPYTSHFSLPTHSSPPNFCVARLSHSPSPSPSRTVIGPPDQSNARPRGEHQCAHKCLSSYCEVKIKIKNAIHLQLSSERYTNPFRVAAGTLLNAFLLHLSPHSKNKQATSKQPQARHVIDV